MGKMLKLGLVCLQPKFIYILIQLLVFLAFIKSTLFLLTKFQSTPKYIVGLKNFRQEGRNFSNSEYTYIIYKIKGTFAKDVNNLNEPNIK